MKNLLLTTIAAVVLVGCGRSVDIWEAAEYGNIETIKHHLANGTDVNVQDFDGCTPLHWAAMEGHKKIAELLIANGADVNLKNMDGNTPLQYAAMAGQIGIAKLLLIKEADLNTKNINDKRPLDVAIKLNHPETAALLRKHGAKTHEELKAEGK